MKDFCFCLATLLLFTACKTAKLPVGEPALRLKFLGEYLLPQNLQFQNTRVGGLSSIDYSPGEGIFYLICDDRSELNDARFYTARLALSARGIDSVIITGVTTLLKPDGKPYPSRAQDSANLPDPEGMRLNRFTGELVWTNEGERVVANGRNFLQSPSVTIIRKNGQFVDSFSSPENLRVSATNKGPRRNGAFEGLTFTPDFKTLFVSVEEPLYEDGPRAGIVDLATWVRFVQFDASSKKPVAQYAYRIDPISKAPVPADGFSVNGVVDILALDSHRMLVTERSFSTGYVGCNVRVYLADLRRAKPVANTASMRETAPKQPLEKILLLNMDSLGREVYNIEGATFGPVLPNGKRSLVFVADDNFSNRERTQFLLFELEE